MNIKKNSLIIAALLLTLVNSYLFIHHNQRTHFECKGKIYLQNPSNTVDAGVYLLLNGDKGKIVVDGTMSENNGDVQNIRRMALIDFTRRGDSLLTTTYSTSRLPEDNDVDNLFHVFFPEFIFYQGAKSLLTLETLPSGSILISNNQSMHIYCEKTTAN